MTLVKEAMLNPALARVLLTKLTPQNEQSIAGAAFRKIAALSAVRGAHARRWLCST